VDLERMDSVDEHVRFAELLDIYGNLLSDRQREYMRLHYAEDLSYGEIAEQSNISRQAVHDAIVHGRESLCRFERELSLLSEPKSEGLNVERIAEIIRRLERIASEDILYDTRRLKEAIRDLKRLVLSEQTDV